MSTAAARIGIDGCRGGWFAVVLAGDGPRGAPVWRLCETVEAVLAEWPGALCLVDIPIGLPASAPRAVEREARRLLGRARASSVFPVPSRAAVYARDYRDACARNREALGVAVSRQAWNLAPKIREVDGLLAARPALAGRVLEAHPELCFRALGGSSAMAHAKKTAAGAEERLTVLARYLPQAGAFVEEVLAATRRAVLARDDVLDALALAVSATLPLARIPADGGDPSAARMVFPVTRDVAGARPDARDA